MELKARIKQDQACHIRFKQYQKEGIIPPDVTIYMYAQEVTGEKCESLRDLKDWQVNALRDRLEGKPNKILERLYRTATESGITDLERWMNSVSGARGFAYLRGHTPETLPLNLQYRLCKCLEARSNSIRRHAPAPTKAADNQPTLF